MDADTRKSQLKYSGKIMRHWYWCVALCILLVFLTVAAFFVNLTAGLLIGIGSLVIYASILALYFYYRPRVMLELMDFTSRFGAVEQDMMNELPVPYGLVLPDGHVAWMNRRLCELSGKEADFHKMISTVFPEIDTEKFPEGEEEASVDLSFGERQYRVVMNRISLHEAMDGTEAIAQTDGESALIGLQFYDVTEMNAIQKENFEQKPVVGLLYMDNYEEAMDSVEDVRRSMLDALVDRRITKYITDKGGLIKKMEKDKYLFVMNRVSLQALEDDRFSLLEDVKTVNLGNSLSVTISIGIGVQAGSYAQNYDAAHGAIEMALARGGDQAVVRVQDKMTFYGGKTDRAESNTRVRARMKAQALAELISAHERVVVMGHKNMDMDSLGACVGVCAAAMYSGKPVHIVLEEDDGNPSVRLWIKMLRDNLEYSEGVFVTHEQAVQLTNENTVVVVVDTNRISMVECEELLYLTKMTVVLDHHRQSADKFENAALSYNDIGASSACEMITEILQYYGEGVKLKPYEADCIYAGIIVDTDNFMTKTGSRTFEAAAYLRQNGADVTRVRKAFRNDMVTYKARAEAVRHAEPFMNSYMISVCPSEGLESPTVVGAKAANELLDIKGVKASFVLTDFNNKIFISARAIDEVNVQIIMERLGGGGHINIAGAQLTGVDLNQAIVMLKEVLTQMTKEGAL